MIIYSTYKVDSFIHTKRPAHFWAGLSIQKIIFSFNINIYLNIKKKYLKLYRDCTTLASIYNDSDINL